MPYFAKVCHIIRINVKSKDFGTALAMWESWHRYAHRPTCIKKSIKPTTSLSLSQTSIFYCLSPLSLPRKWFFIGGINLAPVQRRRSRLAHLVPNLDHLLCSGAKLTHAMKKHLRGRDREDWGNKKHLFGRVRGWCSWFDWFVYTCGSVCTAVPTLSHRESGAKIFWFDIDAYYVAYFWEIWHRPHIGRQQMPKIFTCS